MLPRHPLQTQTLYAELLEQALADAMGGVPGSIVRKVVRGRTYVYAQHRLAGQVHQAYLGAESEALEALLGAIQARWDQARERGRGRQVLVEMGRAARLAAPTAAEGSILVALAKAGLFRLGGVLVGTHAFAVLLNTLGVANVPARTGDIDVAADPWISLALEAEVPQARFEALCTDAASGVRLWPIRGFDPRQPSTSFMVHGSQLRVDLLTPKTGSSDAPVQIASLGVCAQPLRFLDYLMAETMPAVVLADAGILVTVPVPVRFALHKLLVAQERPAHWAAKAQKDLRQAEVLLEVPEAEQPAALKDAWKTLVAQGPGWARRARASVARLDERCPLRGW